jgi:hypothetical protein
LEFEADLAFWFAFRCAEEFSEENNANLMSFRMVLHTGEIMPWDWIAIPVWELEFNVGGQNA